MTSDRNPQARQMGDESMARNLALQAQAIWPQEQALFDRYGLSGNLRVLDLGCGTGEITRRLAQRYPQAEIVGVDILDGNLAIARRDSAALGDRVRYEVGDAFALTYPEVHFDLVVCRHMSQAVPDFPRVLDEIGRVLKRGGWLHLLSEDYGMLRMPRGARDPDRFWVDTLRVPRETFAGILRAWRDGYVEPLAQASGRDPADLRADFDAMIADIETPPRYAVWQVPVVSARHG